MANLSELTDTILTWGRNSGQAQARDTGNVFTPEQVEQLRRLLRAEYVSRNPAVAGDWRKGYEIILGSEAIGVTNGYGRFRVYYRKRTVH